ncbi:hypothetical protein RvY_11866 [Ramazzottius varieornatus]|uniref:Uncharacterized protein n=1 Tax=Ramazzottius varieornatus TaxID=947166 RepID=A0A1D1VQ80_RAMVA|nr:hypothetical protein RvY_11866 [Ramazzottius varieornatus]
MKERSSGTIVGRGGAKRMQRRLVDKEERVVNTENDSQQRGWCLVCLMGIDASFHLRQLNPDSPGYHTFHVSPTVERSESPFNKPHPIYADYRGRREGDLNRKGVTVARVQLYCSTSYTALDWRNANK